MCLVVGKYYSIYRTTEVLFDYQIFASEYLLDCIVTLSQHQDYNETIVAECDILAIDLNYYSDIEEQSFQEEL